MEAEIEWLRNGAARWSLASDQRLLQTLEHMHQKIISKCSETTHQLQAMATSLDEASLTLQNTNNRFMALSNSQFIESRVYEDDTDVVTDKSKESQVSPSAPTVGQLPNPAAVSSSLAVLQRLHEQVTILPSDTDSDSSDEEELGRVILKPKDLYTSRPLPYIIGSHAWKTKWHAGLKAVDSDSESSESKQSRGRELYSDSESEDTPRSALGLRDEISRGSSTSGQSVSPCDVDVAADRTPAEVANELARRLGGPLVTPPGDSSQPEETVTVRKVYRPEKPTTAIIFPSEPPPLSSSDQSEPEDIFAELHRQAKGSGPYGNADKARSAADDLFGFNEEPPPLPQAAKRNATLLPEQSDQEPLADKPAQEPVRSDSSTKKPVGGISLFGTNRNNETIGAAILKRHQRKSISEESDDSGQSPVKEIKPQITNETTKEIEKDIKEKDMIQNLFARPKEIKKKLPNTVSNKEQYLNKNSPKIQNTDMFEDLFAKSQNIQNKNTVKEQKAVAKKTDLFNDNIFDDIDDIFTSNISKVTLKQPEKGAKSLFEDDDNDLFCDVGVIKEKVKDKSQNSSKKKTTSMFDSDDELFSEKGIDSKMKSEVEDNKSSKIAETKHSLSVTANPEMKTRSADKKSIFDSDDELLSEKVPENKRKLDIKDVEVPKVTENKEKNSVTVTNEIKSVTKDVKSIFDDSDDDDSIFTNKKNSKHVPDAKKTIDKKADITDNHGSINSDKVLNQNKGKFFNEDDDDGSLLFSTKTIKDTIINAPPKVLEDKLNPIKKTPFNSPNLFDADDDLFSNSNNKRVEHSKNKSPLDLKQDADLTNNQATSNLKQFKDESNVWTQKGIIGMGKRISESKNFDKHVPDEEISKDDDDWSTEDKESAEIVRETPNLTQVIAPDIARECVTKTNIDEKSNIKSINYSKCSKISEDTESDSLKSKTKVTKEVGTHEYSVRSDSFRDTVKEKNDILSELGNENEDLCQKGKPDTITDIFDDLPPAFEKPKEPKKSKNINALFDDDSDDEALFFKKNDVLVDDTEKPDDFSPGANVTLSGLFHNEPPPVIDVDFVQKPSKTLFDDDNKDFIQKTVHIYSADKNLDAHNTSGSNFKAVDTPKSLVEPRKLLETKDNLDGITQKTEEIDSKKVGKLKPNINLNINVNTLLPGASPKKTPKPVEQLEQPDTENVSESNKELSKIELFADNTDSKVTKSVSFDGEPESSTLDSKISKERAKIQVKRRPSTRRARREAVKNSGIDFGEDVTDNSSSIDDKNTAKIDKITSSNIDIDATEVGNEKNEPEYSLKEGSDQKTDSDDKQVIEDNDKNEAENKRKENLSKDMKSKVVYILNDEDIFTDTKTDSDSVGNLQKETSKVESSNTEDDVFNVKKTNILNIVNNDDDDIFKSMIPPAKTEESETNIKTLGKVYSETKMQTSKISVTDRDDTVFNHATTTETKSKHIEQSDKTPEPINNRIIKQTTKPKLSLFDDLSDSDSELFGKTKNITENNTIKETKLAVENEMRTKSILDSDSDEDLFGSKTVGKRNKQNAEELDRSKKNVEEVDRSKKNETKKIEVKSSLFGDDDDEDIFVETKKKSESRPFPSKSSSSTRDLTPKPVFDDPLSLLGDEE